MKVTRSEGEEKRKGGDRGTSDRDRDRQIEIARETDWHFNTNYYTYNI